MFGVWFLVFSSLSSFAADAPAAKTIPIAKIRHSGAVDFEREILPILKNNCLACHNQTKPKGGLVLETPRTILKGGDAGPAVVAKKPAESLLLKAASHQDQELIMPPPDNKVAAVALKPEELGLVQLWIEQGAKGEVRASTPVVWQPMPAGLSAIYATALTRDGQYAVCGRANQIFVYHLPTGRLASRLNDPQLQKQSNIGAAHRDTVNSLAFSPDGEWIASGGYREVKLWHRSAPNNLLKVPATNDLAAVLLERKWLAATLTNGQVLVSDTNGAVTKTNSFPRSLADLKGDPRARFAVEEKERELTFAKAEIDYHKSVLKAAETNQTAAVARQKKASETNAILAKAASEKQSALTNALRAQTSAARALEWLGSEIQDLNAAIATAEKEFTNAVAAAKAAKETDKARTADEVITKSNLLAATKQALEKIPAEARAKFKSATEKLAAAAKTVADVDKEFKKAEQSRLTAEHEVQLAESAARKSEEAVTVAKAALATAETGAEQATKALDGARRTLAGTEKSIRALAFSPADAALVTIEDSGLVRFWAAETGVPFDRNWNSSWKLERSIGTGDGNSPLADRVNALRFTADGQQLITGGGEPTRGGEIKIWRVKEGTFIRELANVHSDSVFALDLSADGKLLASGAADRFAKTIDLASGKVVKALEGHTHHVLGVAWKRDGRTLVSAGADNVAKVWDTITGDRRKNIEGFNKEITCAAFVGVGDEIVLGSGDGQVVLVKSSGDKIRSFTGFTDYVYSIAVTPDSRLLVAGGADGVLRVWNGKTGTLLAEFSAGTTALAAR